MHLPIRKTFNALIIFVLSGYSSAQSSHIPFTHTFSESGTVKQEFVVKKARLYAINLSYGFSSPSIRQSAWLFSGSTETGAPFNVEAKITSQGKTILDTVITSPKLTSWGGDSLNAELADIKLSPGTYTLQVNIGNISIPPGVILSSGVVVPYRGK